jgi:hypothetical protein
MEELVIIGKLEGQIEGIVESLAKLDRLLVGNGQPGAMERITRIEDNIEILVKTNERQSESIDKLAASVSEMKKVMETHTNDKKQHYFITQLMTDKKTAVFIIGGFFILSLIITDFPVIWSFLAKLLGL